MQITETERLSISSRTIHADDDTDDDDDASQHSIDSMNPSLSIPSPQQQHLASGSTLALCATNLAHSYLVISVFPYSGYLVIALCPDVTVETAGGRAGVIASAFMLGRAFTSLAWGHVADAYGRKTVLLVSLALSCFFSALFGVSKNFAVALVVRFCLGASNGIMGTTKTLVSELARGNDKLEATLMALVMGLWGWGFLFSPAVSGALAEPCTQYPNVAWLQEGWIYALLSTYPFLLPNVVGSIFCMLSFASVFFFVQETLPLEQRRSASLMVPDLVARLLSFCPSSRAARFTTIHNQDDTDSRNSNLVMSMPPKTAERQPVESTATTTTMRSILARPRTRAILCIYWVFSFVGLCTDEIVPLFCISRVAGFGLSEFTIGKILSLCGLLFAVSQYSVYGLVYDWYGLYGSIRVDAGLSAPALFLIPVALLLNRGADNGEIQGGGLFVSCGHVGCLSPFCADILFQYFCCAESICSSK
jgi:MFS family permease